MSTERSSRVLQHGNQKIWFFKFEIEFDLCWRAAINIQVGFNMHLYVGIEDASSSLWGSTSSYIKKLSSKRIQLATFVSISKIQIYSSIISDSSHHPWKWNRSKAKRHKFYWYIWGTVSDEVTSLVLKAQAFTIQLIKLYQICRNYQYLHIIQYSVCMNIPRKFQQ